ncbi:hypothetical protein HDK90DRAFT_464095 [Phyllosticta capitalensis]|uniref:AAA+ ATPase domain-containing protein n=1 Tax=Phyllosticta capitalensis TaxID=121624 RepID=A0ABR1YWB5_9PEZI
MEKTIAESPPALYPAQFQTGTIFDPRVHRAEAAAGEEKGRRRAHKDPEQFTQRHKKQQQRQWKFQQANIYNAIEVAPAPDDQLQPKSLPTISQDLTEGQQRVRDRRIAGLAPKLGSIAESSLGRPTRPLNTVLSYKQGSTPKKSLSAPTFGDIREQLRDSAAQDIDMSSRNDRFRNFHRRAHESLPGVHSEDSSSDSGLGCPENLFDKQSGLANSDVGRNNHRKQNNPLRTKGSAREDQPEDEESSSGDIQETDSAKTYDLSGHRKRTAKFQKGAELGPRNFDWRSHICDMLGIDHGMSDLSLLETIESSGSTNTKNWTPSASFATFHEVFCEKDQQFAVFEDTPDLFDPESGRGHIRGQVVVKNHELYIERHPGLSFIVYKYYTCCGEDDRTKPRIEAETIPSKESIAIVSYHLVKSLNKVAEISPNRHMYPTFERGRQLHAPYPWVFHDRPFLISCIPDLDYKCQTHLRCFLEDYISQKMDTEYIKVESLLSQGLISVEYMPYLFVLEAKLSYLTNAKIPGEILLQRDEKKPGSYDWDFTQLSWPSEYTINDLEESEGGNEKKQTISLALQGEFWEFDGKFYTVKRKVVLRHKATKEKTFPVKSLSIFPIRFAGNGKALSLKKRGEKLWRCRRGKLMSYTGWDYTQNDYFEYQANLCQENARVMIDRQTYKKMHDLGIQVVKDYAGALDAEAMNSDQPPSEDFCLLLPPDTFGYVMRERKWHNVMVEHMSEVRWDKDAFRSLVMDPSTKELIKALVTSQIHPSQATELMSGKGNGLILLLHGGPGTGKTLTAESVAEYTKKPLYRITSGDIGTTPSEVETYLDVVLDLGRRWDCVVLLDEAEIFLQERSLEDLARNTLVSVFLRVLEYFQGILILTSNRVLTFDEAFKSRIQLAIHYKPLGKESRKEVWRNFILRLEAVAGSEKVDTEDLHENVDKLAEVDMNGRQIRNAMTTARQLAMFKDQRMDFEILNYIIGISQKFDKYLKDANEGMTERQLAHDKGLRGDEG